jgi:hypothetical protein
MNHGSFTLSGTWFMQYVSDQFLCSGQEEHPGFDLCNGQLGEVSSVLALPKRMLWNWKMEIDGANLEL